MRYGKRFMLTKTPIEKVSVLAAVNLGTHILVESLRDLYIVY